MRPAGRAHTGDDAGLCVHVCARFGRRWASPAATISRLPAFEAVHPITTMRELRARLDRPDRRCFGLFHVSNPVEPLIVVHVRGSKRTRYQ